MVLDAGFYLYPRMIGGAALVAPANALLAALWCAVAVAAAMALRAGRYPRLLRIGLLVLDPIIILTLFALIHDSLRDTPKVMHPVVVTAAACTLLAASGALRLSRSGALLSGLIWVGIFAVVAAMVDYTIGETLFVCGIIASAAALGVRLAENTRRAVEAQASRVILRRFLPPHLAEGDPDAALALVTQPRSLVATILVSDLRGFTASVEKLDPQAALSFLNELQGALAGCVREHGGTVDKFMGDGMLAVFGAPEPLAGHAAAALRSALAMRQAIASLNASRAGSGLPPLRIGVGIHSGPVVAGCVGSGDRLEFTVIGDTVNTASRLEAATKDRDVDILVSETTQALAGETGLSFVGLGETALRGRAQPLRTFQITV